MANNRGSRLITIKDVSIEAGVSIGTVSNVLNNLSSVKADNKKRVLEAMKQLNYVPNNAARTLKTNISKSIGLIIPDITNPFYPEIARGVEDVARKYGYSIFLCNEDRNSKKELEYIKVLQEKNVDGIIFVKPNCGIMQNSYAQISCPFVIVDIGEEIVNWCGLIKIDDYEGAWKAMQYLYDLGHRKIAFISGHVDCKGGQLREKAYLNFHTKHQIELNAQFTRRGSYDWKSGYQRTCELIQLPSLPTAIFAANDLMAIGAIQAIHDAGYRVPEDISVLGVDDIEMATLCWPRLTTISRPKYDMGAKSMEMVIKNIKANKTIKTKLPVITLKTHLVKRESTSICLSQNETNPLAIAFRY